MPHHHAQRGIIFDLDGTLLNTLDDLANAMNSVLADNRWPIHPVSAYRTFVGNGMEMLVRRALPREHRNDQTVQVNTQAMRSAYGRAWAVKTRPYPGIENLLSALRHNAVPMAILSNKPHEATQSAVRHFFPHTPFAAVVGATPHKPKKPDPATALEIADQFRLEPERIFFLGDSDADMLTARAAGMTGLGAGWGFRGREELLANGAHQVLESAEELLRLFQARGLEQKQGSSG
jgi:phosphoglycolate phosphatase